MVSFSRRRQILGDILCILVRELILLLCVIFVKITGSVSEICLHTIVGLVIKITDICPGAYNLFIIILQRFICCL